MVNSPKSTARIAEQVLSGVLTQYPAEHKVLLPFTRDFEISWGKSFTQRNTRLSAYLFKPSESMKNSFGFRSEVAVFVSDYKTLEPRVVGAINDILKDKVVSARADPTTFFLISADPSAERWLEDYFIDHPQAVTGIGISYGQLSLQGVELFRIHNLLSTHYYARDLFDYRLPISDDINFFGRPSLINELKDRIKKSENFGIYGLRKSGKTSALFKLRRDVEDTGAAYVFYYDCKTPEIRELGWRDLIVKIARDMLKKVGDLESDDVAAHPSSRFRHAVRRAGRRKKLCVIFDEIEYISPLYDLDAQWHSDFVPFWQTLWSVQSEYRRISFGMCGVNPALSEADLFSGVQNPVFGIVQPRYVKGLQQPDCNKMVRMIGDRMGLQFTDAALDIMYQQYGGHPLLTRLACSQLHIELSEEQTQRPVKIDHEYVKSKLTLLDNYVEPHCKHALTEIKRFYAPEYEMLQMLAQGHDVDFYELSRDEFMVGHIRNYGIVAAAPGKRAKFLIPAMKQHLLRDALRALATKADAVVAQGSGSQAWIEKRLKDIVREFDRLDQLSAGRRRWPWGDRNLRFDKLSQIEPVISRAALTSALTLLNTVLIEPIDKVHQKNYFFAAMHMEFPSLAPALSRIRVYRNWLCHEELNEINKARFDTLVADDFGNAAFDRNDAWEGQMFAVCVNELYYGLLMEIDAYT